MKSTNNKSKKSNILIISLIAICLLVAAACQIFCDANKRSYGVFLDTDSENTEQIHDYDTVVIDADNFSADDIRQLHSQGNKIIYSYLNVGSLESFRDYYPEFKDITIGDYENWPEEKWIDVTDEGWQDHIAKTAKSYANKGVDGLFLDNLDVYDIDNSEEVYHSLISILKELKEEGMPIIINGADTFVSEALDSAENKGLFDAVNQECVFTEINFDTKTYTAQSKDTTAYYTDYLQKCQEAGIKVYLLEYTKNLPLKMKIRQYCDKEKYTVYIADDLNLD